MNTPSSDNDNTPASRSLEEIATSLFASESFMWLMVGANHPDMHRNTLRPLYEEWKNAGGQTYGKR